MTFTLTTALVVLAATLRVTAQGPLTIYTLTSPTECQPVQFTWTGGKGPYYLSLIPAGQPAAPAMQQFPVQDGNAMTWIVDMPAGTSFSSALKDSTGALAYSDSQTVQSGPDNSCVDPAWNSNAAVPVVNAASTAAASHAPSTASSAKPAIAQASSASGGSPQLTQPGVGTTSVVHAAGVPSAATSGAATQSSATSGGTVNVPTRNGAGANGGSFGLVGLLGLLGAALLW